MKFKNKLEYDGKIEYDDWEGRKLLIGGIELAEEIQDEIHGKQVQVNYWISDIPLTKDEITEKILKKLYGVADVDVDEVFQGSWTFENSSCVGYDKNWSLIIGGHDLFDELRDYEGQFIIIEFNY